MNATVASSPNDRLVRLIACICHNMPRLWRITCGSSRRANSRQYLAVSPSAALTLQQTLGGRAWSSASVPEQPATLLGSQGPKQHRPHLQTPPLPPPAAHIHTTCCWHNSRARLGPGRPMEAKGLWRRAAAAAGLLALAAPLLLVVLSLAGHRTPLNRKLELASPSILIVSVGSVTRPELVQVQKTTLGLHLKVVHVTELESGGQCVFCPHEEYNKQPELYYKFNQRFSDRHINWYCAQQRPLQALRLALQRAQQAHGQLPRWVVLIDDDTFVDPWGLERLLEGFNYNETMFAGFTYPAANWFVPGGAGTILSQATVQALLAPLPQQRLEFDARSQAWQQQTSGGTYTVLDKCIDQTMGGGWCHFHSDWAIAKCIKVATGVTKATKVQPGLMSQDNNCMHPPDLVPVTCHHANATTQQMMYDAAAVRHKAEHSRGLAEAAAAAAKSAE